jgi:hypothetical protein
MDDIAPMATPKTSGRFKAAPSAAVVWSAVGRPAPGQSAQNLARNDQR